MESVEGRGLRIPDIIVIQNFDIYQRVRSAAKYVAPRIRRQQRDQALASGLGYSSEEFLLRILGRGESVTAKIDDAAGIKRLERFGYKECRPDFVSASVRAAGLVDGLESLMDDMVLSGSAQLGKAIVEHPFPVPLQLHPKFNRMQETWGRLGAVSSLARRFLPPTPPPNLFGLQAYDRFEIYTDWLASRSFPEWRDGYIGVVVKNNLDKPIGIIKWRWWGGSEFICRVNDGGRCFSLSMDIYSTENMPSRIDLEEDTPRVFENAVAGVRETSPLPPDDIGRWLI